MRIYQNVCAKVELKSSLFWHQTFLQPCITISQIKKKGLLICLGCKNFLYQNRLVLMWIANGSLFPASQKCWKS